MDIKWVVALAVGAGIGYALASIPPLGPATQIMLPNRWKMGVVAHINALNKDTGDFSEFDAVGSVIDEENVAVPIYIPHGVYDISISLPCSLTKTLADVVIDGTPVAVDVIIGDINNDNEIGLAELVNVADNYGKVGDEPVRPPSAVL